MKVPPTSGSRPMPVSGIASSVFSEKQRCEQLEAMPTPPPITIPSTKLTTGLG